MRIGIDLMGSDTPPKIIFEGVLQAAKYFSPSFTFVVFATSPVIEEIRSSFSLQLSANSRQSFVNIEFKKVFDCIEMTEEPVYAISHKKRSSLVAGIKLLKKRQLSAFVSAGNTGALLACVTLQLPRLPGIRRPALLVTVPTLMGPVAVLDVGGNVSCKAHQLVQFALMGAAFQACSQEIILPKVGLLNIGVESIKGTPLIRQAYQDLQELSIKESEFENPKMKFVGNVEGRDVFLGKIDVLVTEGFSGNVLLKTAEGFASVIFESIHKAIMPNASTEIKEALISVKNRFNHTEYPGAIVCGIEGVVIKCHGNATATAICQSIKSAIILVETQFIEKMKKRLESRELDSRQETIRSRQ